jgi:hypothetical protein
VWDQRIPEFYSVPTVWSFSMLKALEKVHMVARANLMSTYLKCFLYHREYLQETYAAVRVALTTQSLPAVVVGMVCAIFDESAYVLKAISRRLRERLLPQSQTRIHEIVSSKEAFDALEKILCETGGGFSPPK